VEVDKGAEVRLSEPEDDELSVDSVDKSAAVSDGKTSSLDGSAAVVVAAESTAEVPAAVTPASAVSGPAAMSDEYVLVSIADPEPSTTWTMETVWTTSVIGVDSRSSTSR
jgi:hypothetical protein